MHVSQPEGAAYLKLCRRSAAYLLGNQNLELTPQAKLCCRFAALLHSYRSAAGADPPLKSSRPSANLMERPLPTDPPAFARKPVISTSVPALTVSVFQPSRIKAFGAPSSKRQLVTVPSGSLTST